MEANLTFGERLKIIRERAGVLQKDLASHLQIQQQTVSAWEKGRGQPDIEMLKSIAIYLKCSIDYLTGMTALLDSNDNEDNEDMDTKNNINSGLPEDWQQRLSFIRRSGSKHLTSEEKADLMALGEIFVRKIERRMKEEEKPHGN